MDLGRADVWPSFRQLRKTAHSGICTEAKNAMFIRSLLFMWEETNVMSSDMELLPVKKSEMQYSVTDAAE